MFGGHGQRFAGAGLRQVIESNEGGGIPRDHERNALIGHDGTGDDVRNTRLLTEVVRSDYFIFLISEDR